MHTVEIAKARISLAPGMQVLFIHLKAAMQGRKPFLSAVAHQEGLSR
jgi:hypothetical protein